MIAMWKCGKLIGWRLQSLNVRFLRDFSCHCTGPSGVHNGCDGCLNYKPKLSFHWEKTAVSLRKNCRFIEKKLLFHWEKNCRFIVKKLPFHWEKTAVSLIKKTLIKYQPKLPFHWKKYQPKLPFHWKININRNCRCIGKNINRMCRFIEKKNIRQISTETAVSLEKKTKPPFRCKKNR